MELRRQGIINSSPHLVSLSDSGILSFDTDMKSKVKECTAHFSPVQAAGTPAPDNVLPISGWTGVTGYRTGVNIWDEETIVGVLESSGNVNTSIKTRLATSYIPVVPNTYYRFHTSSTSKGRIAIYDSQKKLIYYNQDAPYPNQSFLIPDNGYYIRLNFVTAYGTTYKNDVSINYPATETGYHPYSGTTYPVDWTDIAGTVYGGYVDLVSGVLVATWTEVTLDGMETYNNYSSVVVCRKTVSKGKTLTVSCSRTVPPNAGWASNDKNNFQFIKSAFNVTDETELKSLFATWASQGSPIQLAYELATPIIYQLTPQQLSVLKGTNNVWSNANGAIDLSFWAHKEF